MSNQTLTFGDICSAIADGSIVATLDGSMYTINGLELRRYLNKFRSQPAVPSTESQIPMPHSESSTWSVNGQPSVV